MSARKYAGPGYVQRLAKKLSRQLRVTHSVAVERAQAMLGIDVVVLEGTMAARTPRATPQSIRAAELEGHTVAELVDFARASGIEGYSGLNKAELIELILAAENPPPPVDEEEQP
jgi:hypothetical protein